MGTQEAPGSDSPKGSGPGASCGFRRRRKRPPACLWRRVTESSVSPPWAPCLRGGSFTIERELVSILGLSPGFEGRPGLLEAPLRALLEGLDLLGALHEGGGD